MAAPPDTPYVFVSYSQRDEDVVARLVETLQDAGIAVWWDRELRAGDEWRQATAEALTGAATVMVVWSGTSATSSWVLNEAAVARSRDVLVPVTIDGYDVVPATYGDLFTIDLSRWEPGRSDEEIDRLIEELRAWTAAAPAESSVESKAASAADRRTLVVRPAAAELLSMAGAAARSRGADEPDPTDVVLAAIRRPTENMTAFDLDELRRGATFALRSAVPEPRDERIDAAMDAAGLETSVLEKAVGGDGPASPRLASAATAIAQRVRGDAVYSHHLVAAALSQLTLAAEVEAALGTSATALRAALRRAVAERWTAEDAAAWDEILRGPITFQAEPTVARDYWTVDDQLGVRPYADAVVRFILHPKTEPPLTIGIKAPWGAGKTSLMRMIEDQLDPRRPDDGSHRRPARLRLTESGARRLGTTPTASTEPKAAGLTVGQVLDRAGAAPQEDVDLGEVTATEPLERSRRDDWRATVWFNPWMYQTGEEVWAGFAHEIIEQITSRLRPLERERFWLELNLRRVDRTAIRRRVYRLGVERLLPLLVTWLVLTVAALVAGLSRTAVGIGGAGGLLATVAVGQLLVRRQAAGTTLTALVTPPDMAGVGPAVEAAFEGIVDEAARDPAYRSRAGFLHFVQTDVRHVLDLVATERQPLVIFVDDLDRCSPGVVAQTIEAINLFLAGEFPNVIFVLALEPAVVAAHVEVAHKELLTHLSDDRLATDSSTLGWRFLEKIVQLPLSLPRPNRMQTENYLRSLFGTVATDEVDPSVRSAIDEEVRRLSTAPLGDAPRQVAAAEAALPTTASPAARATLRQQAMAAILERSFDDDDIVVQGLVQREVLALPNRNAREIKRLLNLFRFYSFIAARTADLGSSASSIQDVLQSTARLASLAIRWPYLLNPLARPVGSADGDQARPPILLERLEAAADDDSAWADLLVEHDLAERTDDGAAIVGESWEPALREFCRQPHHIGRFCRDFL